MRLISYKATFATLWVLLVCGAGIARSPSSVLSWTVLVCLAALPPLVMLRWLSPPRSMSQIIQKALR
jgi:hypothetical protein